MQHPEKPISRKQLMIFIFLQLIAIVALLVPRADSIPFTRIKAEGSTHISISEPSDVCANPLNTNLFIVSDRGYLYETDANYKLLRRSSTFGFDYEAVFADSHFVYAVEERTRRINQFDITTLEKVKTREVRYQGGRNAGYEGFTYNKEKGCFILVTEKNPIWIFELNRNFDPVNEFQLKEKLNGKPPGIDLQSKEKHSISEVWESVRGYTGPSDVSSLTLYGKKLYMLSDEDSEILQLNPATYQLEKRWKLGILNPEGFYFDQTGNLFVLSDNMQKVYRFSPLS